MPATPPTPPVPPPLSFERRRWTALFTLPFVVVMAVSGLMSVFWLPHLLGPRLGFTIGALFALLSVALAVSLGRDALQALNSRGPALVVDARGITDHFHLHTHVPWSEIESATIDGEDGTDLMLMLRPGTALPGGGIVKPTVRRQMGRWFGRADLRIPLGGLVYHHRQLEAALKAHLARQPRPPSAEMPPGPEGNRR
ncbi:MAG: hypothetical protein EKK53_10480 [Burkholderiales bacterium]|nr:MAG: hypothetical protein EKK53_10480 [Burkholderiales bacterium]